MRRNFYLRMKELSEAQRLVLESYPWSEALRPEEIDVRQADGRVTAQALFARRSLPSFNAAAMDGFAVRAEETFRASDLNPLTLKIGQQAIAVNTGDPIPQDKDAVIMIEDVHFPTKETIEIRKPAYPWQHVRKVGEDLVAGELMFTSGHRLAPWDLGALLAAGHLKILVKERPRVIFIPTGDEILPAEKAEDHLLAQGKTVEFNSTVLSALVKQWGGEAEIWPIVPDDYTALGQALYKALKERPHLIAILAGSSAGSKDYTAALVKEQRLLLHGVAIMPGKPVIFGLVKDTPVFGIPGYPVSAVMAFETLVRPVFEAMLGAGLPPRPKVKAFSARKVPSRLGLTEFLRVKVGEVAGKRVFLPVKRGAGVISTLTRAEGIVRIPPHSEGILPGKQMEVELLRPERRLENTVLVVGSHDLALDLLAHFLHQRAPKYDLSLAHVGSLSGILAVRDGLAHMAGTHLFDPETGEFNIPYLKRYLKEPIARLVHFAWREQGLLLPKANPKGIKSLRDLARKDVRFINRQPGSGTRVLLDYYLQKEGLRAEDIRGYETEETTHLGVAIAVATGQADVGLGIKAAAKLLDLCFIPLFRERYDLLVRNDFWETEAFAYIYEILREETFAREVEKLGGYDMAERGKILF